MEGASPKSVTVVAELVIVTLGPPCTGRAVNLYCKQHGSKHKGQDV